ncbi:PAS domain S-box protein [Actinoplanes subglobosus]|uniref:histidine kinase n=1 Tax=Actinoplanes subglobosus TaxID=1547892 RepID=A0ABV8JA19_9ACTN
MSAEEGFVGVEFLDRPADEGGGLLAEAFARSLVPRVVIDLGPGRGAVLADANDEFCVLSGRGPDQLRGLPWQELVAEADRPAVGAALQALLEDDIRAARVACRLVQPDGSSVRVSAGLMAVPAGPSDARCAVAEVIEQPPSPGVEGLVEAVLDATPDLLAVTTPDGLVVRVNAAWERVLGWSQAEMQDVRLTTLMHPDDVAATVAEAQRVAEAGDQSAQGLRNRYRTKSGDYRWLEWGGAPLPGTALVCGMARDVTDAIVAEEALRRSESQFRAVFEASPLAMAVTDETGRLQNVNRALSRLVDRPAEQLLGRRCAEFTHPDDLRAGDEHRDRMAADPHATLVYEQRVLRPDGRVVWVRASNSRMDAAGGQQHRLVQIEDITASRQAAVLAGRETDRLRATIKVQREITAAASDREAVLALMADRTLAVLPGGDTCVVQMLDETAALLHTVAGTGRLAGQAIPAAPLTGSLAGLAVTGGIPVRCDDTATDPRASRAMRTATGTRSLVAAPLRDTRGRITGVLLAGSGRPYAFDDADEQQLTLLAHALSGALQHADDAARSQQLLDRATQAVDALQKERTSTLAALEKLARSEQRFVTVFSNSPVAKILVTAAGPGAGRITLANPAFEDLTGYPGEQATDLHLADLTGHPAAAVERGLALLARGHGPRHRELEIRHRDGRRVTVSAHTSIITDENDAPTAVVQLLDITAMARVQAELADLLADRTRALTALEISEQRFRLTFDNSPLGVTLISLEPGTLGNYLQANPAMTGITGYTATELTGMTYRDLVHPEDVPGGADYLQRVNIGPSTPARAEYRYRHKDGHTVWVAVTTAAVRDDTGRPLYLVNQVEDVTSRRATDIQLRRQARLLELIPAAVIVRDLDGRIRWWNHGATHLYGWPSTAARHKISHRLLGTAFPGTSTADDQARILLRDGRWDGELQHHTAHGTTVTVLSQQVLHHPTGKDEDPQVLEINTDITAERAAEQALAENEQRLRAQFTNSAAGQVVRELGGRFLAVNPAYARMLGYTVDQLLQLTDADLLDPTDLADSRHLIAGLFTGDTDHYTHEGRLRHADGHWVDVEATVSLTHHPDGRPKHILGVITDITSRRAAEHARDTAAAALAERNTELEAANQLKLDIIGMLGHEIGNPLTSIRGNAELLTDDWPDLTDAQRTRSIAAITRQSDRLDSIVGEVLAMVTIDAGKLTAARQDLDLHEHITLALAATDNEHLPVHGPNPRVLFHPGQLQQILVNLLSNAAKYGGGATAIRTSQPASNPGHVHVAVEDNGPGVPEEFRERLFERLTRADRDATTVRGTGLGLYIVRGLAHANHGDIHHEPNPTGGSIFTLDLQTTTMLT